MPQHEKLSILPFRFPPIPPEVPQSVRTWIESFQQCLEAWKNAQAQINVQSGIKSLDSPTGEGYNLGWDSQGRTGFIVGDVDNDSYIHFSGADSRFIFGDQVVVQQGDNAVYLAFGIQAGDARDGEAVTFSPAFPSDIIPIVIFGQGGISYDSSLTGDQNRDISAQDLTNTGFTLRAKLNDFGSFTARTLNFSGGAGVTSDEVTKTLAAEAYDDKYTFSFNVTVPGGTDSEGLPLIRSAEVGLYARTSGGSYSLYKTFSLLNSSGGDQTYSKTGSITVNGLVANSRFKVEVISGSATLNCNSVTYTEGASINTVSATPNGSSAIPWLAIGTRSG